MVGLDREEEGLINGFGWQEEITISNEIDRNAGNVSNSL